MLNVKYQNIGILKKKKTILFEIKNSKFVKQNK